MTRLPQFLAELKRRRVYHVAVMYAATAFVAAQAADLFLPRLGLPDWTVTFVVVLAVAGFPVALILGWTFDITPGGVRRTLRVPEHGPLPQPASWRVAGGFALAAMVLVAGGWWLSSVVLGPWSPVIDRPPAEPAHQRTALAVLPFQNLSVDRQHAYFAGGLHDELLTQLPRWAHCRSEGGRR